MWKWVTCFSLGNLSHTDEVPNQWPCCWWDHFSQNAVQRLCRRKCESEPMFTSYLSHTNKWNQSINHPRVNMALSFRDSEWELINFPVWEILRLCLCVCVCVHAPALVIVCISTSIFCIFLQVTVLHLLETVSVVQWSNWLLAYCIITGNRKEYQHSEYNNVL